MVSPGWLRTLDAVRTDADHQRIEPEIDQRGRVTYPFVTDHLDARDGPATDFLEAMSDRGIFERSFVGKVYVCPECFVEGMQYSTACWECESLHATRVEAVVHTTCDGVLGPAEPVVHEPIDAWDHANSDGAPTRGNGRSDGAVDPVDGDDADEATADETADDEPDTASSEETIEDEQAADDDGRTCPDCATEVVVDDIARDRRYRCHDCADWVGEPRHRLRCRSCETVRAPGTVREEPLYQYPLTEAGATWITSQLETRRLLADTFDARGYESAVDSAVRGDGDPIPVHIVAEDDLLDDRLVAGVHESPTIEDVTRLGEAAAAFDARPVVLAADGALDEPVAERIEALEITVLSAVEDELSTAYEIRSPETTESPSLLSRLVSVFEPRPPEGRP